jgi:hypothetical protein
VVCKAAILIGLLLALLAGQFQLGLAIGILGPALAEVSGVFSSLALLSGRANTDGKGVPLAP